MKVKEYNCQLCDSKIFTKVADYTFKNKIFKKHLWNQHLINRKT